MKKVILAAIVTAFLFSCTPEKVQKNDKPPTGTYIFRAKSVDLDGTVSFSTESHVSY